MGSRDARQCGILIQDAPELLENLEVPLGMPGVVEPDPARTIRRRISDGTVAAHHCGRRAIGIPLAEHHAAWRRVPSD